MGAQVGITDAFIFNNTVQFNNFHDIGEGVIVDFGCVHFANLGGASSGGNTFANNICHDLAHNVDDGYTLGGHGIYMDNDSQNNMVQYNLVYRTSGALFYNNISPNCSLAGGCNNTISNNIFAYSYEGALKRGGPADQADPLQDFVFKHNIVLYDVGSGPQWLQPTGQGGWTCNNSDFNRLPPCWHYFGFFSNGYWSPNVDQPTFVTMDSAGMPIPWIGLSGWQTPSDPEEDGTDAGGYAVYRDPQFVAPNFIENDYHFRYAGSGSVHDIIKFDPSAQFSGTYKAGRNSPIICPPSPPPGFPLQLLSPLKY